MNDVVNVEFNELSDENEKSNGSLINKFIDNNKVEKTIDNNLEIKNQAKILEKVYEISQNPNNFSDEIQTAAGNIVASTIKECFALTRRKFKACNTCKWTDMCKKYNNNSRFINLEYRPDPSIIGKFEVFDNRDGKFKIVDRIDNVPSTSNLHKCIDYSNTVANIEKINKPFNKDYSIINQLI